MSLTKEDLQAISLLIRQEIHPLEIKIDSLETKVDSLETKVDSLETRLSSLETTVEAIKEDTAVTREAVNSLIEWAEQVSVVTHVKFPARKAQ